jgi:flavin-dependent dehydrogenase
MGMTGDAGTLTVVGAGPAGLAAAIVARRTGRRVVVYERGRDVGGRFHGDFQGLENWSAEGDVLEEMRAIGIEPTFDAVPFREQVCFGPDGREHVFRSAQPFYYLVRRGSGPGTLDRSLKEQALAAGAEIRFGERVRHPPPRSVAAWGPRRADALAVGYLFETDHPDGSVAVLDDRLAPKGYGYLLVQGGRATLAACLFDDFHDEAVYLERTVEFLRRRIGFSMRGARRFGGIANVHLSRPVRAGHILWAGEAMGAQDALWGFGIRYALRSGELAASFPEEDFRGFRRRWEAAIGRPLRASFVNRFFYGRARRAGYRWLLWRLSRAENVRHYLRQLYAPTWWKRALFPLVYPSFSRGVAAAKAECGCTWCAEREKLQAVGGPLALAPGEA